MGERIHFDRNRKVHLARRDAFFERAVQLLNTPTQAMNTSQKIAHIEAVMSMLEIAERHAFFALQSSKSLPRERDFLRFIRLLKDNVQSALSMLKHQLHLQEEESFLCQFLGATPEQCMLPALHYQRRAEDILQGLWNILQLAHNAYHTLRLENLQQLSPEEAQVYEEAYRAFQSDASRLYTPAPFSVSAPVQPNVTR